MLTFRFSGADGTMEEKEILTAGMVRKKVKLVFSRDWDNMTKTVVFTAGSVTRAIVGVSNVAEIPAEVLATPLEDLYVGVYGVSRDGTVTPTIRVKGPEIKPGTDPNHDAGTDPDLAIWAQLQLEIDAIRDGGIDGTDGGYYVPEVTQPSADTLEISFFPSAATMPTVEPTRINLPSFESDQNQNSGLDATASALLISILRNAVYSTDQSASITALENALATGGGSGEPDTPADPDEPVVTAYTIANALLHATSNNASASVESGESYTATITAEDGYTLDGATVTVTMGGLNITATAYANGIVHIASVTGNVIITVAAVVAVQSDILYQLASPLVCTADGSDPIDTGVKISDSDKDFTFCAKITCTPQPSSTWVIGDSLYNTGFNIVVYTSYTKMIRIYGLGNAVSCTDDWRLAAEGQSIIVISHVAGSGEYKWKMAYPTKEGRESYSPSSGTISKAFAAYDENAVRINKGAFTGSVDDLVIYNRVLTDDEITAYLGV